VKIEGEKKKRAKKEYLERGGERFRDGGGEDNVENAYSQKKKGKGK